MGAKTPLSIRKRIGFTILAVALAWASLEVFVLVYWFVQPRERSDVKFCYQEHPYRAYTTVPNTAYRDGTYSINSAGFRGPMVCVKKPADTIRLICVGGSTTLCPGATTDSHTYPARMELHLRDRYREQPFRLDVINAGIAAANSIESLIYVQTLLLDWSPDIIVFHHGLNDTFYSILLPDYETDYSHARKPFEIPPMKWWEASPLLSFMSSDRSIRNPYYPDKTPDLLTPIITRPDLALDTRRLPEKGTPEMTDAFRRNVHNFVAVARGNNVIPVLSTMVCAGTSEHPFFATVQTFNEAIREEARREGLALIDFDRALDWNPEAFYDACHMSDNAAGLEFKGRLFAQSLIEQGVVEAAAAKRGYECRAPAKP